MQMVEDTFIEIADHVKERLCLVAVGITKNMDLVNEIYSYAHNLSIESNTINSLLELPSRVMFYAQLSHESGSFKRTLENTNYSARRAYEIWPSDFASLEECESIVAMGEEALFNRVYGDRLGNKEPSDGFKYIGRGFIHTTGRYNYQRLTNTTGVDFIANPELLEETRYAMMAALSFLINDDNLNDELNNLCIEGSTSEINGGLNGLDDRERKWNRALRIIEGFAEEESFTCFIGSRSLYNLFLQFYLNVKGAELTIDGHWGNRTQRAIKEYLETDITVFTKDDLQMFSVEMSELLEV